MKRIAVYAGTFDPLTLGHLDILDRALKVFEKVHVAVAANPSKKTLFSVDERVQMVTESLGANSARVTVAPFEGLLVDYVKSIGANVVIRGLRAVADYEYEAQMALVNRALAEDIETVFLVTSAHCSFISSSFVRDVARNKGSLTKLVSNSVANRLRDVFSSSK